MSKLREAAQAVLHAIEHGHPNVDATLDALHEALREHALVRLSNTHQELDTALTERMTFNHWWNEGEVSPGDNPYTHETAAYWAWEGWQAGAKAEREACAAMCDETKAARLAEKIRARGEE